MSRMQSQPLRAVLFASVASIALATAGAAYALPTGGSVVTSNGDGTGVTTINTGTPGAVTIDQGDSRVIIDWSTFNIGNGETVTFNQTGPDAVAFNFVTGPAGSGPPPPPPLSTIDGALNANGGVWLFSPGGVVFGANARVDVGSFVASTGAFQPDYDTDQLLYPDGPGTFVGVGFTTDGSDVISVANGATINANSGFVVLQAQSIIQNGDITATDGIGYIVSAGAEIDFNTTSSGQQLINASADPVANSGRPSFTQGATGSTAATFVTLSTPTGQVEGGYHGIINLGGTVDATGLVPGATNTSVKLTVGGDDLNFNDSAQTLDASAGTINATHGVAVVATNATMGIVNAGGALDIDSDRDITLAGAVAAHDVTLTTDQGTGHNVAINADLHASGNLAINTYSVTASAAGTVEAQNLNIDGRADATFGAAVNVSGAADVQMHGESVSASFNNGLHVDSTLRMDVEAQSSGIPPLAKIKLLGPVTVGGLVDLTAKSDDLNGHFGGNIDIITSLRTGGSFTADTGDFNGNSLDVTSIATIDATNLISLTGTSSVLGDATLRSAAGGAGSITTAGSLDVNGKLTAIAHGNLTFNADTSASGADIETHTRTGLMKIGALNVSGDLLVLLDEGGVPNGPTPPAGTAVTLTGPVVVSGDADIEVFRRQGNMTIGNLQVSGDLFASAVNISSTAVGTIEVSGNAVMEADTNITLAGTTSVRALDLTSFGGAITISGAATVDDDADLRVESGSGSISVPLNGSLAAGGNIHASIHPDAESPNPIPVTGVISVAGAIHANSDIHLAIFDQDDTSPGGTININGNATTDEGSISAFSNVFNSSGFIASAGDLDVVASSQLNLGGDVSADGNATLSSSASGGAVNTSGSLTVGGNLSATGADIVTDATVTVAGNATLDGLFVFGSGPLSADGTLTIDGSDLINMGGDLSSGGTASLTSTSGQIIVVGLSSGADVSVNAAGDFTANGHLITGAASTLTAGGDLTLNGASDFTGATNLNADESAGQIAINGPMNVVGDLTTVSFSLETTAPVTVTGDLNIDPADVIIGAAMDIGGSATITAGDGLYVNGDLTAGGDLTLVADTVSSTALIHADGALEIDGTSGISLGGPTTGGNITLNSDGLVTIDGDLTADNLTISAGSFDSSGLITLAGGWNLTTAGALNLGSAIIDGDLNLTTTDVGAPLSTTGTITVHGDMTLSATGDFSTPGAITVGSDTQVDGDTHLNGDFYTVVNLTGPLNTGGATRVDGHDFTSSAALSTGDNLDIHVVNGISLGGATTVGGQAIIEGSGDIAIAALLDVTSDAGIFGDDITTTSGGVIQAANLNIQATTFTADGAITAGGDLSIQAIHITLNGFVDVGGDADLFAYDQFGSIASSGGLSVGGNLTASVHTGSEGGDPGFPSGSIDITGPVNVTGSADLAIYDQDDESADGDITVHGTFETGAGFSSYSRTFTSDGLLTIGGNADLVADTDITLADADISGDLQTSSDTFTSTGAVTVGGDLGIDADGAVTLGGPVTVTGAANIDAGGEVVIDGDFSADQTADISGAAVSGSGAIHAGGALSITGADGIDVGDVSSDTDATLSVGKSSADIAIGSFDSPGGLTISGANTFTAGGPINVGGDLSVTVDGDIALNGGGDVGGDAILTSEGDTGLISIGDALHVGGDMTTNSFAFHNTGTMDIEGNLSIDPGGDIVIDADTTVGGDASLVTDDNILIHARLDVGGRLDMDATDITSTAPGVIDVNGAIGANARGDITLGGTVDSGQSINIAADGDLAFNADTTAVGSIAGSADTITVASEVTVRSDSQGDGEGSIDLSADRDFTAATDSLIVAGAAQGPGTDFVSIVGGAGSGGDTTVGQVRGRSVAITVYDGDLNVNGAVTGEDYVDLFANFNFDPEIGGDVHVAADITSGGFTSIYNRSGAVTVDGGVTVQSTTQTFIQATDNVTIGGQVSGGSVGLFSDETLTVSANGTVTSTAATTAPTWPIVGFNYRPGGEGPPTVHGITLAAHALTLNGTVTAGSSQARSDVFIQPLGTQTGVTIGGTGGSGFQLTNAALGHITARNVVFLSGAADGRGSGYDVTIGDLTLDSEKLAGLWVGAQSSRKITVSGTVTGDVAVRLGFAQIDGLNIGDTLPGGGGSTLLGYIPGEIDITGGLGAADSALDAVSLIARNNIFMGSSTFIAAAQADPAFDATKHSQDFATLPVGHLFVSASTLDLAAQGRIIQQNTAGPNSLGYAGIAIDSPSTGHPLISAVTGLEGMQIGGTGQGGWTAHFGAGPTQIDLFGVLTPLIGDPIDDEAAAKEPNLLAGTIVTSRAYRINTCIFGTTCVRAGSDVPPFQTPPETNGPGGGDLGDILDEWAQAGLIQQLDITAVLPIKLDDDEEEKKKNQSPITGSGNGDLWGAHQP
ncbi:MAG: filamentous hemagglutinin family outer membrane protein [Caulobacter sp.]|nr:filamentous hemagglutinin family outer membrane protein [Caulobacter sp.]